MADTLSDSDYVDIDFDTISQALTIITFHAGPPFSTGWTERISNLKGAVKAEIGVLANEPPKEPEELSLGGFLTTIGEDSKPSPTIFSFPARHHPSSSTYHAHFLTPTGLHPTLRLTFPSSTSPPSPSCFLHTHLTLPSILFPDKYQLSSPLFLASKNLRHLRSLSGETDLEAPDWAVDKWGSAMLLELAPPKVASSEGESWRADIPLHLRYLPPAESGVAYADVPWPVVFWACTAEEGSKMSVNPFDRVNLGYEGLFGPRTMFYHLSPDLGRENETGRLVERLAVPVLATERAAWVEAGTVVVVLAGFAWVLWTLLGVGSSDRESRRIEKREDKKVK
ncbi:protease B nonderepressible form [Lambiella insularis]|nr:protease B nonderepressible form [Lambiella insularis]